MAVTTEDTLCYIAISLIYAINLKGGKSWLLKNI